MSDSDRWKVGRFAIVVSGLPASGKSTLGVSIAERLGIPCLDKDDFLERLYDSEGVGNWSHRGLLSRKSDELFRKEAGLLDAVVLVSHWRPRCGPGDTGTPTVWLSQTFDTIVEVHCSCSPENATQRFLARKRHPGHLDGVRSADETTKRFRTFAEGYPLGVGDLIEVDASSCIDVSGVVDDVQEKMATWQGRG